MTPAHDRRRWVRMDLVRPCKAFLHGRFAPGRTCNLSRAGALLTLESARQLSTGDRIELSIQHSTMPVLPAQGMIRGRVARCHTFDTDRQLVAVQFEEHLEQLADAA